MTFFTLKLSGVVLAIFFISSTTFADRSIDDKLNSIETKVDYLITLVKDRNDTGNPGSNVYKATSQVDANCIQDLHNKSRYGADWPTVYNYIDKCRAVPLNQEGCKIISGSTNSACVTTSVKISSYGADNTVMQNLSEKCKTVDMVCKF